jgi:protein SCO1/2
MTGRHKLILGTAAVLLPTLTIGLPVLAVRLIGPERSDAAVAWLNTHTPNPPTAISPHVHPVGVLIPPFSLTDQLNRPVTADSLRGRVWVASFFLSRCSGACPMTSAKMAKLQREIRDPRVVLASFSMDPGHDTPEVLREYAGRFGADPERWHLLTGDRGQIVNLVAALGLADGQAGVRSPADMIHSDQFVLVDASGHSRGTYSSSDPGAMEHLARDAEGIAGEK